VHIDSGANSGEVSVAVIDSGIDYIEFDNGTKLHHQDLEGNVVEGHGFKYVSETQVDIISDYKDESGHGTGVSGVIAAVDNDIGIIGVAPKAKIYALKLICSYPEEMAKAIDWATLRGIQVIVLATTWDDDWPVLKRACDNAFSQGSLVIAAAGNNNGGIRYPAKYGSVVAVGAVEAVDEKNVERASWSNFGSELDLMAPGVLISTTWKDRGWDVKNGTSFAAPHVAAVAALIWTAYPSLANYEVREKLFTTALDLGTSGWDDLTGYGLVNAYLPSQKPSGNVNNDNNEWVVDIFDLVKVGYSFGGSLGDVNWNVTADSKIDRVVDIFDIVVVALNWGSIDP
jgi:subtilisin family serine protease